MSVQARKVFSLVVNFVTAVTVRPTQETSMRLFAGILYYVVLGIMLNVMLHASMNQIYIFWGVIAAMNLVRRQH